MYCGGRAYAAVIDVVGGVRVGFVVVGAAVAGGVVAVVGERYLFVSLRWYCGCSVSKGVRGQRETTTIQNKTISKRVRRSAPHGDELQVWHTLPIRCLGVPSP